MHAMVKRKRLKGQAIIYKTLHRLTNNLANWSHKNLMMNSGRKGSSAPLVAPVVLVTLVSKQGDKSWLRKGRDFDYDKWNMSVAIDG